MSDQTFYNTVDICKLTPVLEMFEDELRTFHEVTRATMRQEILQILNEQYDEYKSKDRWSGFFGSAYFEGCLDAVDSMVQKTSGENKSNRFQLSKE